MFFLIYFKFPKKRSCTGPGQDQCIDCAVNFERWGNLCFKDIPVCESGSYSFYNVTWSCKECPLKCKDCIYYKDAPICRQCADNFYKTGLIA